MLYSQMSPEQRKILMDDPESYPLRIAFLGKVGILTQEEVAFLRENGVDFDVGDGQAAEALGEGPVLAAAARRETRPTAWEIVLGALVALFLLLRRLLRR